MALKIELPPARERLLANQPKNTPAEGRTKVIPALSCKHDALKAHGMRERLSSTPQSCKQRGGLTGYAAIPPTLFRESRISLLACSRQQAASRKGPNRHVETKQGADRQEPNREQALNGQAGNRPLQGTGRQGTMKYYYPVAQKTRFPGAPTPQTPQKQTS